MKTREDIQNMVWHKIRGINNGSITLEQSHSSDDQFVELVEYFLTEIDETEHGQELADLIFISRSFESVEGDDTLYNIKSNLGILDSPNDKEYVEKVKDSIKKDIVNYKNRKSQ